MRARASRFLTDRYACRTQLNYLFELVAFGIVVLTAVWPMFLVANAMAAHCDKALPVHEDAIVSNARTFIPRGTEVLIK